MRIVIGWLILKFHEGEVELKEYMCVEVKHTRMLVKKSKNGKRMAGVSTPIK